MPGCVKRAKAPLLPAPRVVTANVPKWKAEQSLSARRKPPTYGVMTRKENGFKLDF